MCKVWSVNTQTFQEPREPDRKVLSGPLSSFPIENIEKSKLTAGSVSTCPILSYFLARLELEYLWDSTDCHGWMDGWKWRWSMDNQECGWEDIRRYWGWCVLWTSEHSVGQPPDTNFGPEVKKPCVRSQLWTVPWIVCVAWQEGAGQPTKTLSFLCARVHMNGIQWVFEVIPCYLVCMNSDNLWFVLCLICWFLGNCAESGSSHVEEMPHTA